MRRIYVKCDKCGVGHSHKLPRPGQDQNSFTNVWNWDKNQYVKLMRVLCTPCSQRERKR